MFSCVLSDIDDLPSSFISPTLERPETLIDQSTVNNLDVHQSARPIDLNIPLKPNLPVSECETRLDNLTITLPRQQGTANGKTMMLGGQ